MSAETIEHTVPEHLRDAETALLRVEDLEVQFPTKNGTVQAVSGVSFDLMPGETLGIVGESGSGKSTTAKAILGLLPNATGTVRFQDRDLLGLGEGDFRSLRPLLQMIFQDPIASLNPRRKIEDLIAEGLTVWPELVQASVDEDVDELLREVGMAPDVVRGRKAHEFSGGQCQRIAIARALALQPRLLVCDEPVSALDVSVQAQILNLLRRMKETHELSLLFVSHDLSVIRNICDRVLVMYLGKVCEIADADALFDGPAHPYTQLLFESVPQADQLEADHEDQRVVPGEQPSPLDPPSGCRFRTRCPLATDLCAREEPLLRQIGPGQYAACHFAERAVA